MVEIATELPADITVIEYEKNRQVIFIKYIVVLRLRYEETNNLSIIITFGFSYHVGQTINSISLSHTVISSQSLSCLFNSSNFIIILRIHRIIYIRTGIQLLSARAVHALARRIEVLIPVAWVN